MEKMIAEMMYIPTSVEEMNRDCIQQLKMLFDKSEHYTAFWKLKEAEAHIKFDEQIRVKADIRDYDATGKLGSGFTDGEVVSLGNYQQCLSLNESYYCMADVSANALIPGSLKATPVHILWGICAVDICNASTIESHVPQLITDLFSLSWLHPEETKVNCVKPIIQTTSFWVAISVLLLLMVLLVLGTIVDVHHRYTARMKWHLLYHVSTNVRHLVGPSQTQDHMTWTTIDESYISNDSLTAEIESRDTENTHRPPNERLIEMAFQYKPGVTVHVARCFSVLSHIQTLSSRSQSNLRCLDGLRVLSLCVIILGQSLLATYMATNRGVSVQDSNHFGFLIASSAYCSIDTFFFISGLLCVFNALNSLQTNDGKRQLAFHYIHRLLRLTPSVAVVMLFWIAVMPYVSNGPLWSLLTSNIDKQSSYWWTTIINVQNFYPVNLTESCMPWLWFISADFQLFCFVPVLLFFLRRSKAYPLIVVPLTLSVLVTGVLIGIFNLDVSFADQLNNHDYSVTSRYLSIVWTKPYCRAIAYLTGCLLGYRLHIERGLSSRLRKHHAAVGWLVCLLFCGCVIFIAYTPLVGLSLGTAGNVMYGSLRHFAWSAAMAWIVYSCYHGFGGPFNCILSSSIWVPVSKLTYGTFICHGVWISWYLYSQQTKLVVTSMSLACAYLSTLFGSFLMGTLVTFLVELPVRNFELYVRS